MAVERRTVRGEEKGATRYTETIFAQLPGGWKVIGYDVTWTISPSVGNWIPLTTSPTQEDTVSSTPIERMAMTAPVPLMVKAMFTVPPSSGLTTSCFS